jgi:hypothetical protein
MEKQTVKLRLSDKDISMTLGVYPEVLEEYKRMDVSGKTVSQQMKLLNQITEFLN